MKDPVESVKETIARLETAWNHRNGYLWSSAFTEPCDYIDVFGHFHQDWSREANAYLHTRVWAGVYAKSHMGLKIRKINFPSDHLCICVLDCHLEYEINALHKTNDTIISCTLAKHGPEWQIRHFQNTAFRPY